MYRCGQPDFAFKNANVRDREMTQWGKNLLCWHEDSSSDSQHPSEEPGDAATLASLALQLESGTGQPVPLIREQWVW